MEAFQLIPQAAREFGVLRVALEQACLIMTVNPGAGLLCVNSQ